MRTARPLKSLQASAQVGERVLVEISQNPDTAARERALVELVRHLRARGYSFITPTPATHARVNARPDNAQAHDLAGVFGWSRPFRPGVVPDALLQLMRDAGVLEPLGDLMRSTVRVSTLDDTLFVHSAYPTVASDSVFFGPDTYRFARAIEWALRARQAPVRRAADIGCGAGPGAIVLAKAFPDAESVAVDINRTALLFTRANAEAAGLANVNARHSDLLSDVAGTFDLIVSNPPYLNDPLARAYRHGGGRFGDALSLAIVDAALRRLSAGGTLLLYTGSAIVAGRDAFLEAATERLRPAGVAWTYSEMDPDVFGEELEAGPYRDVDRIAAVVLMATKRGD